MDEATKVLDDSTFLVFLFIERKRSRTNFDQEFIVAHQEFSFVYIVTLEKTGKPICIR